MFPSFELFGRSIPTYWVCALIGFAVCGVAAVFRRRSFLELEQVDITNGAALIGVGIIVGGRALSALTQIPYLISNRDKVAEDWHFALDVLSNGMVFYGGLFGALLALYLYLRRYKLDQKAFFDFFIPLFPLFHAFGRVGCFLTGCCHGVVSERYGLAFTNSLSAQNGVPYFPIQLVCSACNILLFVFLLLYEKRRHRQGKTLPVYLAVYAVGRFVIEFFRGDEIRGFILGLSTSQWISIFVLIAVIIVSLRGRSKAKKAST